LPAEESGYPQDSGDRRSQDGFPSFNVWLMQCGLEDCQSAPPRQLNRADRHVG